MIEKTIYISVDGKQFETKENCLHHEEMLTLYKPAIAIKNFCMTSACESCPFFRYTDNKCYFFNNPRIPSEWNF